MSKKDNFSQAMFEMFGLGKAPEEDNEELDDLEQLENLSADDMSPETEAPVAEASFVEERPAAPAPDNSAFGASAAAPADAWSGSTDPAPAPAPAAEPAAERSAPVRRANCTYFAEGTSMEGTLRSDSDVEIVGDFKGEIASDGKVTIHSNTQSSIAASELVLVDCVLTGDAMVSGDISINERSAVTGNIRAANIICSGIIRGNLNVTGNISLTENAQIVGDIKTNTLAMSRGARVSGKIDMSNS